MIDEQTHEFLQRVEQQLARSDEEIQALITEAYALGADNETLRATQLAVIRELESILDGMDRVARITWSHRQSKNDDTQANG